MKLFRKIRLWFFALFRKRALDAEMEDELRSHIEMQMEEHVESGVRPEDARRAALLDFGPAERIKESCRDQRGFNWLEHIIRDLCFAVRILRKNRAFTAVAVITLALGIGATTAIFSVVNAVLLKPLPYDHPEELVLVWADNSKQGLKQFGTSFPNYSDWRDQNSVFRQLAAVNPDSFNLLQGAEPERVFGANVTANFFETMGVKPLYGRVFLPGEDAPGRDSLIVMNEGLWRRRFGGDTNLIGHAVTVNGKAQTLIGVVPEYLRFPYGAEVWAPINVEGTSKKSRGYWWLTVIGRLRPGVAINQAQKEMDTIARRLEQQYPETHLGWGAHVMSIHDWVVGDVRAAILLFVLAGVFVLLVGCANVANLQMIRSTERRKELSIRAALGATGRALVRQLLAENMVLFALGGVAGLGVAYFGVELLRKILAGSVPRIQGLEIDGLTLGFTCCVSLGTGLLFGLWPALAAAVKDLYLDLRLNASTSGSAQKRLSTRDGLVVSEIALALMLLITSTLLIQSFWRLQQVKPGFDRKNLLVARITLPETKYFAQPKQAAFYNEVLRRVESLPGVRHTGLATTFPLSGGAFYNAFLIEGESNQEFSKSPSVLYNPISQDYFAALNIPLRDGRLFDPHDDEQAAPVAIVNEAFVRRFCSEAKALNMRIRIEDGKEKLWCSIVGVVGDVRQFGPSRDSEPEIYLPLLQRSRRWMTLFVSTEGEPLQSASAVRAAVAEVDQEQPLHGISSMDSILKGTTGTPRSQSLIVSSLAYLALILSAVGIYGVMAFSVAQRTREIGIRTALGASRRNIVHLIVGRGLKMTLWGIVLGWTGAFILVRSIQGLLFGVAPTSFPVFAILGVAMAVVALIASWIPVRRAAGVDPVIALRCE